jgi:hypothetical protein
MLLPLGQLLLVPRVLRLPLHVLSSPLVDPPPVLSSSSVATPPVLGISVSHPAPTQRPLVL